MTDNWTPFGGQEIRITPRDTSPQDTASATTATKALMQQLVDMQIAGEVREAKMLFWTRVAGIGAIAALAVAIVGITVTLLVA